MRIETLKLKNYRNYDNAEIEFSDTYNIIYGNNAQGKTNVIESIFLCATGRSHRTSRDSELLKYGSGFFEILLKYSKENADEEIHVLYSSDERKKISINEIPLKKIGGLMGHLNAVMFSPEDLLMIKQGPAERRRFMDMTLSQLRPSYFYDLQQYAKILFQRNNLLKNISTDKKLADTLEVWDHHLAKTGSRIMRSRKLFLSRLDTLSGLRHSRLTNNEESLKLNYSPSFEWQEIQDGDDLEEEFIKNIKKNRQKELLRGSTSIGPHRDDIDITLNGESTKIYASQGQQRTSVLSMKLAEIDLMKEETEESPVLLLDDVLSELDDRRKEYLLDNIEGIQAFITSTEKRFFTRSTENAKFFIVKQGKIKGE
ncbi:MAG: DNA replication/repair protein RecF [Clostridiaceae bacterium]|nr:DNA replication/repair protein RecF [Clostridiaceae bacterium]